MTKVRCPFCENEVEIDIRRCVDEDGEVHMCPKCHNKFRWVEH